MRALKPVVVTGVGLVCAGDGEVSRCHGHPDPEASALGVPLVASVHGIADDPDFPDDRKSALARVAVRRALTGQTTGGRRGLWLGTGLSSLTPAELEVDLFPHLLPGGFDRAAMARDLASDRAAPRRHLPSRATEVLAAEIGASQAETSFSACAAAAQSIAAAARAVARGDVDVALAGGQDSMLHPIGYLSFVVLGALSGTRCRPFDRNRDGFMIGEGAACLVMQREEDARANGAPVLARILGSGTSVDAWAVTAPHPDGHGAALAMQRALDDAGITAADVDYVNAHGTGTPVGDRAEALAVRRVLGDVRVSSVKGAVGHTIAAAGAVEAAICVQAFRAGMLPGTVGLEEVDPELPINVLRAPVALRPRVIVSNSFGFGGQNCSLVFGRP